MNRFRPVKVHDRQAQAARERAQSAVNDAEARLEAAKRLAEQARQLRDDATDAQGRVRPRPETVTWEYEPVGYRPLHPSVGCDPLGLAPCGHEVKVTLLDSQNQVTYAYEVPSGDQTLGGDLWDVRWACWRATLRAGQRVCRV